MNHWFLCGRDVMWFLFAVAPVGGGWVTASCLADGDLGAGFWMLFMSLTVQFAGIAGLYFGVIK